MGWASGTNPDGREVGYSVVATCDKNGCDEKIDRGLAYVCGQMHGGDEHCCGGYFCYSHLSFGIALPSQMCEECADRFDRENPEIVAAAVAAFDDRAKAWRDD